MKCYFFGAARQVTGSMHMLETPSGKKILIDCGLDYEKRTEFEERNNKFPFQVADIDLLILTHAHIDHCGNIPNLIRQGFSGKIICTPPTLELSDYLLHDSLNIQKHELRQREKQINKNRKGSNKVKLQPLYSITHIADMHDMARTIGFNYPYQFDEEITVEFFLAGHILGAASAKITISHGNKKTVFGYTGDLGNYNSKLVPDPQPMPDVEYLISESTYGGRLHTDFGNAEEDLYKHFEETCIQNNGKLVIPAFSVGRTQAILFTFHQLYLKGKIPAHIKLYTDSPLAIKSTRVYQQNLHYLNDEAKNFQDKNHSLFTFPNLFVVEDDRESEYISVAPEACVIVSAAGMVEGGRIQMHVRNNIGHKENRVLIAGFCADGTLGHRLLQGQDFVEIKHKKRPVFASVFKTDAFSAHPDQNGLLNYLKQTNNPKLKKVFLVHGDYTQQQILQEKIDFVEAIIPEKGSSFFVE